MNNILIVPDLKLRQKTNKITKVTSNEIEISKKMMDLVQIAPGVGLAANQIGILKSIVVINIRDEESKLDKRYSLFNPKINFFSEEKIFMEEGCLSLPQQFAEIERSKNIEIEYLNENNKLIKAEKSGYEARVIQHEIDHLEGKLFVDYLSSLKRNKILKRIEKLKKLGEL